MCAPIRRWLDKVWRAHLSGICPPIRKMVLGVLDATANEAERSAPPLQLLTLFEPPPPPQPLNRVLQEHVLGETGLLSTCWKCTLTANGKDRTFLLQTISDLTTSPVRTTAQMYDIDGLIVTPPPSPAA